MGEILYQPNALDVTKVLTNKVIDDKVLNDTAGALDDIKRNLKDLKTSIESMQTIAFSMHNGVSLLLATTSELQSKIARASELPKNEIHSFIDRFMSFGTQQSRVSSKLFHNVISLEKQIDTSRERIEVNQKQMEQFRNYVIGNKSEGYIGLVGKGISASKLGSVIDISPDDAINPADGISLGDLTNPAGIMSPDGVACLGDVVTSPDDVVFLGGLVDSVGAMNPDDVIRVQKSGIFGVAINFILDKKGKTTLHNSQYSSLFAHSSSELRTAYSGMVLEKKERTEETAAVTKELSEKVKERTDEPREKDEMSDSNMMNTSVKMSTSFQEGKLVKLLTSVKGSSAPLIVPKHRLKVMPDDNDSQSSEGSDSFPY